VDIALGRLVGRSGDPEWAAAMLAIPFCLDDLTSLLLAAGDEAAIAPIIAHHLARLEELRSRLDAFVDHSAQDRRHLLTDDERAAADEAAHLLGGD
jgi:hypothetical protein